MKILMGLLLALGTIGALISFIAIVYRIYQNIKTKNDVSINYVDEDLLHLILTRDE
jgi:hypothetical protein